MLPGGFQGHWSRIRHPFFDLRHLYQDPRAILPRLRNFAFFNFLKFYCILAIFAVFSCVIKWELNILCPRNVNNGFICFRHFWHKELVKHRSVFSKKSVIQKNMMVVKKSWYITLCVKNAANKWIHYSHFMGIIYSIIILLHMKIPQI